MIYDFLPTAPARRDLPLPHFHLHHCAHPRPAPRYTLAFQLSTHQRPLRRLSLPQIRRQSPEMEALVAITDLTRYGW